MTYRTKSQPSCW